MLHALAQAEAGDAPFGSVMVQNNVIVAAAYNTSKSERSPLAHAEMNLIRATIAELGTANLETCSLYATVEPCPMCMGAILWAKVGRLVFGASTNELKEFVSVIDMSCREIAARSSHRIEVIGGVLTDACLAPFRK
jgi:tRNA(adenine34) deaminase